MIWFVIDFLKNCCLNEINDGFVYFKEMLINFKIYNGDNYEFDLIKSLCLYSLYFCGFVDSISFLSDCANGFNKIVKFNSNSRCNYLVNIIKCSIKCFAKDGLFWMACMGYVYYLYRGNALELVLLYVQFMILNLLLMVVVAIYSKNSMYSLIMYLVAFPLEWLIYTNGLYSLIILLIIIMIGFSEVGSRIRGDES